MVLTAGNKLCYNGIIGGSMKKLDELDTNKDKSDLTQEEVEALSRVEKIADNMLAVAERIKKHLEEHPYASK